MIIYVDDLLLLIRTIADINTCKIILNKKFDIIDLSEVRVIISIRIIRNRTKKTIFLNQKSYVLAILNKKDLSICNFTYIFIDSKSNILSNDTENQKETNIINY